MADSYFQAHVQSHVSYNVANISLKVHFFPTKFNNVTSGTFGCKLACAVRVFIDNLALKLLIHTPMPLTYF